MDNLYAIDIMHQNIANRELTAGCPIISFQSLNATFLVVGTSPGDLAMGSGLRVAQLASISCDMALWVRYLLVSTLPSIYLFNLIRKSWVVCTMEAPCA